MPYRWPWDGRLEPERAALVVLCAEKNSLTVELTKVIQHFAEEFGGLGGWTVTVQTAEPRQTHAADAQEPLSWGDSRIRSGGLDGFFSSQLDQILRRQRRDHLLLAGTWLETSVHSTMRSANDRGYECLLLDDIAPPADPELRQGAISSIQMSGGIFGAVCTTEAYREVVFPSDPH